MCCVSCSSFVNRQDVYFSLNNWLAIVDHSIWLFLDEQIDLISIFSVNNSVTWISLGLQNELESPFFAVALFSSYCFQDKLPCP